MTHTQQPEAVTAIATQTSASVPEQRGAEEREPIDTREMIVVHTAFRREFRLMAGVVNATPSGDTARAKVVSEHIGFMIDMLHHHHTNEDRLLWPKLLERVSGEMVPIVLLMSAQHEKIADAIELMQESREPFAATGSAEARRTLADACEHANELLHEHLDAEEERLLPIAARHIELEEWEQLGEEGMDSMPKRQLPLVFGMMKYEADPEVLAKMLAGAPAPIRVLMPRLSGRAFRKYALRVHGTATP
jgi:hemerythrin-like domain-containing protein